MLASFKLNISDANGKTVNRELREDDAVPLLGLQVGDEADASIVKLKGKLRITGGSDKSGISMRKDVHGAARKAVLLTKGVGLQKAEAGQRIRKLVRGNTISEEIYQVNCRYDGTIKSDNIAG